MRTHKKRFVLSILLLLAFLSACSESAAQATQKPTIQLEPCRLGNIPAQCGTLAVYENRATNTERMINIHVAVVKASDPKPEPDPIFYLAGGPGASGINDAGYATMVLKSALQHRDLVLFDQRGTGKSNRMACPRQMDERLGLVPFNEKMLNDLRVCLENLDGDPRAYTTAWGMDDLEDVRIALGYDQINLYGESYGTAAEMVYLQRHGNHVRTMTLEGVSLLDITMFERMPRSSQEALELLYARCQADQACNTAYPNLHNEVETLLERLDQQPVELALVDPYTGQNVRLNRHWLALGIHDLLITTPSAVLLPSMVHQAYLGDWSQVTQILSKNLGADAPKLEWSIMNLTILCHEDWARARREETEQFGANSYMGYEELRIFLVPEQVCAQIPQPQPEALHQPLDSSPVPVLIISNEADPQNPPENVATASKHYPNSLVLVAPGQGHGYLGYDCRDQILADFIETGTTQGLNVACLQNVPLPDFVISE